jgi:hypothetical protein
MRVSAGTRRFQVILTYPWRRFEIAETNQNQKRRRLRRSRLIAIRFGVAQLTASWTPIVKLPPA